MAEQARTTTDHDEIRRWAGEHGAVPATVRDTMEGGRPGVLTFDVEGYGADEDQLEHIDWDGWFDKFEESGLALLFQEEKVSGEPSTFFKLVARSSGD